MAKAMLVDVTKCMGCRACQIACKQWNEREAEKTENFGSYENPPDLSAQTWTKIKFIEEGEEDSLQWHFRRVICQHCSTAACEKVCPPKAISHQQSTAVVIDQDKCTGCKYCITACPFNVPRYNPETNTAMKCTLCIDRITNGLEPACARACPTDAVQWGERDVLITAAKDRISFLEKKGFTDLRLYGETELDGLGVMFLLAAPATTYGFPDKPEIPLSVGLWQNILKPLAIVGGAGAVLAALVSLLGSIGYKHGEEG